MLEELIEQTRQIVASSVMIVEAEAKKRAKAAPTKATRVDIEADGSGFSPSRIAVPRGVPVTLSFLRTDGKNCASEVIFEVDGKRLETKLPVGQRVEVTVTFTRPGPVPFHCGMYRGTIDVR